MENSNLVKELAPLKVQISKAETDANDLQIKTKDDLPMAAELLSEIKIVGKAITEKKESITKPLNLALKNARAFFAPVETQYENAERIVKNKMNDFQNAEIAKAAKKTEVIENKVEEGKMSFDKAVEKIEEITPEKKVEAKSGSIQFRTVKEVIIKDENKIPREYLVLDMVKIRKVALAGIEIPGVEVVEKQSVAGIVK